MKQTTPAAWLSALLILLFGYTAFSKLLSHSLFETTLSRTPFISSGAAVLAWLVPLSELAIVLLLLFPLTRRWGFWGSLVLLSSFTLYLAIMLLTASHLPCSCGGVISALSWEEHLGLNLAMIGLTLLVLQRRGRSTALRLGRQQA
jgi:putative oxidoreductase